MVHVELERVEALELLGMVLAHLNNAEAAGDLSPRIATLLAVRDKLAAGLREQPELRRRRSTRSGNCDREVSGRHRRRSRRCAGRCRSQRRASTQGGRSPRRHDPGCPPSWRIAPSTRRGLWTRTEDCDRHRRDRNGSDVDDSHRRKHHSPLGAAQLRGTWASPVQQASRSGRRAVAQLVTTASPSRSAASARRRSRLTNCRGAPSCS